MTTNIIDNQADKLHSNIYPNKDKDTIILLHGGPGVPMDFVEIAEALKDRFQVITFHQRGTKQSPCPDNNYSIDAYMSDIDTIAKFYNVDRFHLWGHSWGAIYAQIYAGKHPEKILSLFLCSSGAGTGELWRQTEEEVIQFNKSKCMPAEWREMGVNNLLGMLGSDKAYQRMFRQVMRNYNSGFVITVRHKVDFDDLTAKPINRTRKEILKYPMLQTQHHPDYKVTIVYGEKDIYRSSKTFVKNRYPTAIVHTIENCGHLPWLHNPAAFQQILAEHYGLL